MDTKIWNLAKLINEQQIERFHRDHPTLDAERECHVNVMHGKKYTKLDVGSSGKYMVENETGNIYGIKAYGVIHRGHFYGTLDTINNWDWSGYAAVQTEKSQRE
jgi:hypothetical protein